jgi:hypothetical protein
MPSIGLGVDGDSVGGEQAGDGLVAAEREHHRK